MKPQHSLPLYIFSVYQPSDNNMTSYDETLSELKALTTYYMSHGQVIVGGDFNAEIRSNSDMTRATYKTKMLTQYINSNNLIPVNLSHHGNGPYYSYEPAKSMIDHFLVDTTLMNCVETFNILDESELILTSDHLPFVAKLTMKHTTRVPKQYAQ